ncbi:LysR family transcriptional regulator [Kosakonia sp. MUSA4]|uniref:LysR family transcriptional regulator n=1 Tax=Kosakonia sp. MUSA4 TaxID=2067958 RepID=UPI001598DEBC|nr:LysR family transcriptional regulator [Kosakonia sp. MUSA4]QJT80679.1 LysR family transcriptional regulator [Kosakonia sp. MUSA4]
MKNVSLSDLKAFLLVARLQSFQQAAGELGVSRSALSHAMRALETRLGVRLLHRTTRSVSLTQQGAAFLQRLDPLLNTLDDVLDSTRFQPQELHGTLRINANEGGARWLLQHVVVNFLRAHPQVELDLVTDGRLVDIVAAGFDAGVRLAEAVPRDMIAVPFGGDIRFITLAAPGYLEQAGTPQTPEDLLQHRCIAQRLPGGKRYRWEFMRDNKPLTLNVPGTLCLDNSALMVEAVVLGLGIAYVPEPYARQALNDGLAVQVLETWCPPIAGLCLYYASHRHVPATLKAFIAAIRAVA